MKSEAPTDAFQAANKKLDPNLTYRPVKSNQITMLQSTIIPPKPKMCSKNLNESTIQVNKKIKMQDPMTPLTPSAVPQVQEMQLPYSIDMINAAFKKAVQQLPKEILNKVIVNSNGEVINLSPPDPLAIEPSQLPQNMIGGITSVIKNKSPKRRENLRENKVFDQNIVKIDLTDDDHIEEVDAKYTTYCKNSQNNNFQAPAPNPTVIFPVPQYQVSLYHLIAVYSIIYAN